MCRDARISFSNLDACHLYQWAMFSIGYQKSCPLCQRIEKRLRDLIGPAEVRHIRRQVIKERKSA